MIEAQSPKYGLRNAFPRHLRYHQPKTGTRRPGRAKALHLLACVVSAALTACATATAPERTPTEAGHALSEPATGAKPRNIIFFLGDGMGAAQVKAYRTYADDPSTPVIDPLVFDPLLVGAIATESITLECERRSDGDCPIDPYGVTDSAASATAYATGQDTLNGMLSQGPDGERLGTVLEAAAARGMGTGVVSTSQVTHASPAAFVVHVASRRDYAEIANQFFDNQIGDMPIPQVILGGGVRDFRREDRNLIAEFEAVGYEVLEDAEALENASGERLLGLFAPVALPRHWDRPESSPTPTLAAMTQQAIATLDQQPQGFFLVVEGSQVDWAGHGNDVAGVVSEMEGFTEAISVGLDYAAQRTDTLVVITADHETGGMSIGRDGIYRWNPRPLRNLKGTPAAMIEAFAGGEGTLAEVVEAYSSLILTLDEMAQLEAAGDDPDAAYQIVVDLLSRRTDTGWTTGGHTGVDVPLYATGPGAEALRGTLQNEQLGQIFLQWVAP
ncbi:MAG: alkaline phosphatase [Pseudomonadota bacterium]